LIPNTSTSLRATSAAEDYLAKQSVVAEQAVKTEKSVIYQAGTGSQQLLIKNQDKLEY
jgi:hypothetical protein